MKPNAKSKDSKDGKSIISKVKLSCSINNNNIKTNKKLSYPSKDSITIQKKHISSASFSSNCNSFLSYQNNSNTNGFRFTSKNLKQVEDEYLGDNSRYDAKTSKCNKSSLVGSLNGNKEGLKYITVKPSFSNKPNFIISNNIKNSNKSNSKNYNINNKENINLLNKNVKRESNNKDCMNKNNYLNNKSKSNSINNNINTNNAYNKTHTNNVNNTYNTNTNNTNKSSIYNDNKTSSIVNKNKINNNLNFINITNSATSNNNTNNNNNNCNIKNNEARISIANKQLLKNSKYENHDNNINNKSKITTLSKHTKTSLDYTSDYNYVNKNNDTTYNKNLRELSSNYNNNYNDNESTYTSNFNNNYSNYNNNLSNINNKNRFNANQSIISITSSQFPKSVYNNFSESEMSHILKPNPSNYDVCGNINIRKSNIKDNINNNNNIAYDNISCISKANYSVITNNSNNYKSSVYSNNSKLISQVKKTNINNNSNNNNNITNKNIKNIYNPIHNRLNSTSTNKNNEDIASNNINIKPGKPKQTTSTFRTSLIKHKKNNTKPSFSKLNDLESYCNNINKNKNSGNSSNFVNGFINHPNNDSIITSTTNNLNKSRHKPNNTSLISSSYMSVLNYMNNHTNSNNNVNINNKITSTNYNSSLNNNKELINNNNNIASNKTNGFVSSFIQKYNSTFNARKVPLNNNNNTSTHTTHFENINNMDNLNTNINDLSVINSSSVTKPLNTRITITETSLLNQKEINDQKYYDGFIKRCKESILNNYSQSQSFELNLSNDSDFINKNNEYDYLMNNNEVTHFEKLALKRKLQQECKKVRSMAVNPLITKRNNKKRGKNKDKNDIYATNATNNDKADNKFKAKKKTHTKNHISSIPKTDFNINKILSNSNNNTYTNNSNNANNTNNKSKPQSTKNSIFNNTTDNNNNNITSTTKKRKNYSKPSVELKGFKIYDEDLDFNNTNQLLKGSQFQCNNNFNSNLNKKHVTNSSDLGLVVEEHSDIHYIVNNTNMGYNHNCLLNESDNNDIENKEKEIVNTANTVYYINEDYNNNDKCLTSRIDYDDIIRNEFNKTSNDNRLEKRNIITNTTNNTNNTNITSKTSYIISQIKKKLSQPLDIKKPSLVNNTTMTNNNNDQSKLLINKLKQNKQSASLFNIKDKYKELIRLAKLSTTAKNSIDKVSKEKNTLSSNCNTSNNILNKKTIISSNNTNTNNNSNKYVSVHYKNFSSINSISSKLDKNINLSLSINTNKNNSKNLNSIGNANNISSKEALLAFKKLKLKDDELLKKINKNSNSISVTNNNNNTNKANCSKLFIELNKLNIKNNTIKIKNIVSCENNSNSNVNKSILSKNSKHSKNSISNIINKTSHLNSVINNHINNDTSKTHVKKVKSNDNISNIASNITNSISNNTGNNNKNISFENNNMIKKSALNSNNTNLPTIKEESEVLISCSNKNKAEGIKPNDYDSKDNNKTTEKIYEVVSCDESNLDINNQSHNTKVVNTGSNSVVSNNVGISYVKSTNTVSLNTFNNISSCKDRNYEEFDNNDVLLTCEKDKHRVGEDKNKDVISANNVKINIISNDYYNNDENEIKEKRSNKDLLYYINQGYSDDAGFKNSNNNDNDNLIALNNSNNDEDLEINNEAQLNSEAKQLIISNAFNPYLNNDEVQKDEDNDENDNNDVNDNNKIDSSQSDDEEEDIYSICKRLDLNENSGLEMFENSSKQYIKKNKTIDNERETSQNIFKSCLFKSNNKSNINTKTKTNRNANTNEDDITTLDTSNLLFKDFSEYYFSLIPKKVKDSNKLSISSMKKDDMLFSSNSKSNNNNSNTLISSNNKQCLNSNNKSIYKTNHKSRTDSSKNEPRSCSTYDSSNKKLLFDSCFNNISNGFSNAQNNIKYLDIEEKRNLNDIFINKFKA